MPHLSSYPKCPSVRGIPIQSKGELKGLKRISIYIVHLASLPFVNETNDLVCLVGVCSRKSYQEPKVTTKHNAFWLPLHRFGKSTSRKSFCEPVLTSSPSSRYCDPTLTLRKGAQVIVSATEPDRMLRLLQKG